MDGKRRHLRVRTGPGGCWSVWASGRRPAASSSARRWQESPGARRVCRAWPALPSRSLTWIIVTLLRLQVTPVLVSVDQRVRKYGSFAFYFSLEKNIYWQKYLWEWRNGGKSVKCNFMWEKKTFFPLRKKNKNKKTSSSGNLSNVSPNSPSEVKQSLGAA